MAIIDYIVLVGYLVGIVAISIAFAGINKSSAEMFAAGGRSPWWAAGLSGFMTMFSAGTFVVWGGVAYKHGLVAICINLCYGVAALLAGYLVAGRWKRLGIRTPAEFIQLRFGPKALHFYTSSMTVFRMISVGVSLYSLALLMVTLMSSESFLGVPGAAAGTNWLPWVILLFGGIVVTYTLIGGLWAVLVVDVLQFIVLNLAVTFVVVLSAVKIGSVANFVAAAPRGFFSPVAGGYTWFFLVSWCAIHFFMIGAEWAFVQRYICVPSEADARKGAYLFGALYLVSPFVWMLPPMIWRIQAPPAEGASPEQIQALAEVAYIQSCRAVLPVGMVGMMMAAMFSATASTVSAQLNVFAGVLTNDIYLPLVGAHVNERSLVRAGRIFTLLLGAAVVAVALSVPYLGGAEPTIVAATSLAVGPLLAPVLWGLFSRSIGSAAVWVTAVVCLPLILLIKVGVASFDFTGAGAILQHVVVWIQSNQQSADIVLGLLLPIAVLALTQAASRGVSLGWQRVEALRASVESQPNSTGNTDRMPAQVIGWSIAACGVIMAALTFVNQQDRLLLWIYAAALLVMAALILFWPRRNINSSSTTFYKKAQ